MTSPAFKGIPSVENPADLTPEKGFNWDLYREGILFLAIRALGDRTAAEDVVQETMLRAVKAFNDPQRAPVLDRVAFLHGIARHVIVDAQRSRNSAHLTISDQIPAEHPDALSLLINEETRDRVRTALRNLPHGDRRLLDLAFIDALKSPEIAERLGESPEAIRKRKSRLIERLRAILRND